MSYRILADRSQDEAEWLEARRKIVTASESAHLMNATDPHWTQTPEQLAQAKADPSSPPSPLMSAGSFWEGCILEYLGQATGLRVEGSSSLCVSLEHPWMGATPDGYVRGTQRRLDGLAEGYLVVVWDWEVYRGAEALRVLTDIMTRFEWRALVEIKNQESKRRPKWNKEEGPPAYYVNQCQHQMVVVDDYDLTLLCAKVDANELYVHPIVRDELYQELLVDVCKNFATTYLTPPE